MLRRVRARERRGGVEARTEGDRRRSSGFNLPPGDRDPVATDLDAGMWAAAADGRLVIQRCGACHAHRYPPTRACYRCRHTTSTWDEVPGTGVVATFTWLPHPPGTEGSGPTSYYNVAVVTLDGTEGDPVRMLSNVVDAWHPGDLAIGMLVEVVTLRLTEGIGLPLFRRSSTRSSS
jgi:uncharacterized OB-fold protein